MTFHSRGSLACENCRRRRIKCNQLRPRCSQCARAGLTCSGYRSTLDLNFKDQTAKIASQFRPAKKISTSTQKPTRRTGPSAISSLYFPYSLTMMTPALNIEDMACKYYFTNFNITRPDFSSAGDPEPYIANSSTGMCSATAVGLAALAIVRNDPHMMDFARRKYSAALRYLARAVADPAELEKGSTTSASFNLSMFEMMISDSPSAAYSWMKHIQGTAALMRVLQLPTTNMVFARVGCLQIAFTVVVGCLIVIQPVPRDIIRLIKSFRNEEYPEIAPIVELFIILSALVNLYVEAEGTGVGAGDEYLSSALSDIDADLVSWKKRLPPIWTGDPNIGSIVHSGNPYWIPKLWGYYQLCRILTHRVMLDHTRQSAEKQKNSLGILSQMLGQIYEHVPMMMRRFFHPTRTGYGPCLTSDVFFLVTILQALIKLTDRRTVVTEWAGPSQKQLGEGFDLVKDFVDRFLY